MRPSPLGEAAGEISVPEESEITEPWTPPHAVTARVKTEPPPPTDLLPSVEDESGPWKGIGATVLGASHRRSGKPNQDSFRLKPHMTSAGLAACVSDGHGGRRYFRSHHGSAFAAQAALYVLDTLSGEDIARIENREGDGKLLMESLGPEILKEWRRLVAEHIEQNPMTELETQFMVDSFGDAWSPESSFLEQKPTAYGATLVLALATESGSLLVGQIGDGDIIIKSGRAPARSVFARSEGPVSNETESLCQESAPHLLQSAFVFLNPNEAHLILLSTDGYSNSFTTFEDYTKVADDLTDLLADQQRSVICQELPMWLHDTSRKGSGDDITAVVMWRPSVREQIWNTVSPGLDGDLTVSWIKRCEKFAYFESGDGDEKLAALLEYRQGRWTVLERGKDLAGEAFSERGLDNPLASDGAWSLVP